MLLAHEDLEWLGARLDLMERYCMPSLARQTDPEFTWLIGADIDTPPGVIARLKRNLIPNSEILFTSSESSFDLEVRAYLQNHPPGLTIRLDSDDAIAPDFIRKVRRFKLRAGEVLNLPHGLGLFENQGLVARMWLASNPFIAYMAVQSGDHVLNLGVHSTVAEVAPITNHFWGKPMWLKVHGPSATSKLPTVFLPLFFWPSWAVNRRFPGVDAPSLDRRFSTKGKEGVAFFRARAGRAWDLMRHAKRNSAF